MVQVQFGENETEESAQMKRVVSILIQMQKQVESNVGLKHVRNSHSFDALSTMSVYRARCTRVGDFMNELPIPVSVFR